MDRREFIKNGCALCGVLMGFGALSTAINSCAPLPFVELNQSKGEFWLDRKQFSVEQPMIILKNKASTYDIAVVQIDTTQYKALELQCTHQPNPILPTKTGFQCSVHGSSFSLDGRVVRPPASRPLKEFSVRTDSDRIYILLGEG